MQEIYKPAIGVSWEQFTKDGKTFYKPKFGVAYPFSSVEIHVKEKKDDLIFELTVVYQLGDKAEIKYWEFYNITQAKSFASILLRCRIERE